MIRKQMLTKKNGMIRFRYIVSYRFYLLTFEKHKGEGNVKYY